ncbi:general transcription factor IIF subunit 1-like [Gymnodraco acuticeps]|uniref:Transcription initiation factor IIF subunit alpha n=1 Tax=Gymnodraco acuticeps TaxID=8218 RepID=A0A6P8V247_GYMAC|nr:general transcription factor IIF subunit 1-like [Gymnodraco acuticeps]XP_034071417.1 general transcription factor IIF subunit 1-like [Gymnodraco acuticeps]XP_034071418.1 general transcription factor IIF subunit 1-like [Gymnodraco acuticeps]XP_034071421.1 general transcription factor IIF subunit 1-like [Gymnodraco acuticeps]XP_034071422.1 general transcription factor IIF subunit 1-like [Gymnodraco acuticeps]XP_034071423.1 general transcription factor IIF subunit 1-like [Gymnodraco acuticeps]
MTSLGSSSSPSTEYTVRVPKNTNKKYSIMGFNSGDKVNCSAWTQARMERDMSARRIYGEEESVDGAAGSEFGKKQREESRRKKYGIVKREFKVEDQPWILKVNGKAGKRFKGLKKGSVTENASYYIFTQCPDGAFEAFPVNGWYNFVPQAKHRTLTAEEAEEEWGRRNKVVNHFSIMLQRRFREQEHGCDDDDDDNEKGGKKKKKGGRGGDLRITDLEEDLEMSSSDSNSSNGDDGESKPKKKKETGKGKGKKKKKKSSDKEALEDSDDGDNEGLEVDYMSDESSSDEEPEKGKMSKGEDHPKGIDEASESEEESEEEKQNEEETKEEEEEEEAKTKTPAPAEKKKKKDSSGESETSDDSDIEGETASALFMKKRTPPKRGGRGSAGSSKAGSRPGTPSIDSAATSNTLRAAASKLEQGKRPPPGPSTDSPAAKRLKMEPSSQSPVPSGKSTPQPPPGKSTPSSSDVQLTEEAVRRYLIRKPMTTKDLLKKFQTKRTGLSSEQTVNVLAQILKRLNPERKNVNDKMHFYLTE